jgi:hypothetical protein
MKTQKEKEETSNSTELLGIKKIRWQAWKNNRWKPRYIACIYQRAKFRRRFRHKDKWIEKREQYGLCRELEK